MRWLIGAAIAALGILGIASAASAETDDPSYLAFQFGVFDFVQDHNQAAAFALEYRNGERFWLFKPVVGLMGTSDGGAYGYAGIALDLYFGNRIVVRLGFAPGAYYRGNGLDLGSVLEFRSSGEIAYRFEDRSRLGITAFHLSNASTGRINPGVEVIMLSYSMPITKLFGGN
ncbi:MAG: acyloxyacyl hydrolase [Alphaproteobacteria bacterium]